MSFQNLPDFDSPIIHSHPSSETEGGVYCAIFLSQPRDDLLKEDFTPPPQPAIAGNDCVPYPSVYVIGAPRGECFKSFKMAAPNAVHISLTAYIDLLHFFTEENWLSIIRQVNYNVDCMRQCNVPIVMDKGMHFYGHGYCQYVLPLPSSSSSTLSESGQENLPEATLFVRQESKDELENRYFVHLCKNRQSVVLPPSVMMKMAEKLPTILGLSQGASI